MYKAKLFLFAFIIVFVTTVSADHLNKETVVDRIKPSGSVYRKGDDIPASKPAVVAASSSQRTAESIYKGKCAMCHATDAIGAPMFGNADSWRDRIAKGEKTLINNAINGFNAMPARGTCGDCSDDEIKATVEYMVKNSQ